MASAPRKKFYPSGKLIVVMPKLYRFVANRRRERVNLSLGGGR